MNVDEKNEGAEPWREPAPSKETGSTPDLSTPSIPVGGENCNFDASNFLNFIAKDEQFTFQTLDDHKDRPERCLTHVLHGRLEQHLPILTELNACGAGIFFTVNATDLKGRGTANITKVRAFFVDPDGSPLEPVLAAPLLPHIVVMLSDLHEFKRKFGHFSVAENYNNSPGLRNWIKVQRREYKNGTLPEERLKKLEGLGFAFAARKDRWEKMFDALCAFKNAQRHCNVPRDYEEIPGLGEWVHTQCIWHKNGKLSKERIEKLDQIGFTWDMREAQQTHKKSLLPEGEVGKGDS